MRKAVRAVHLWLGMIAGALLVFLGLTGTILVFYPELDRLLHPELQVQGAALPAAAEWDRALATVRAAYPDKHGAWRFEVTGTAGPIPARYYDPPERAGRAFRPMMVWLSPDGSQVLRRDYWGEYAMTFVYDLHYRLSLEELGGQVVGWSGFVLLALLVSGLWAWWPRGTWRKAARLRLGGNPLRSLRDWHKLAGLAGVLPLVALTVTGIMLALPDESRRALGAVGLPDPSVPPVEIGPVGTGVGPGQAAAAAMAALPGARLAWIETPPAEGGTYRFRLQVPGDPSFRFPRSHVLVDAASGRVARVQDLRGAAGGTRLVAWLHPLHDGSAGSVAGRILVALAGLLPAVLFVTGVLRWLRRRGAARS